MGSIECEQLPECDTSTHTGTPTLNDVTCDGQDQELSIAGCSPIPAAAKCNSITGNDITAFCADDGANGLIDTASQQDCNADPCVKADDAGTCCKANSLPTITKVCSFAAPTQCIADGRRRLRRRLFGSGDMGGDVSFREEPIPNAKLVVFNTEKYIL
jgi:hypothetical protein